MDLNMNLTDDIWLQRCLGGDRAAQKQLFEQMYAPMFRVCQRYVPRREDAEDCLMKGFQKVFANLPLFRREKGGNLPAWVRRIMVNECLMYLRSRSRFLLFVEEDVAECQLPAEVLLKLDAERLNTLVMQLPDGYRTVFLLHALEGYAHREIASLLQISENTSKTQYSKARARLKVLLEAEKQKEYGSLGT